LPSSTSLVGRCSFSLILSASASSRLALLQARCSTFAQAAAVSFVQHSFRLLRSPSAERWLSALSSS
jgi:hypothetical protein